MTQAPQLKPIPKPAKTDINFDDANLEDKYAFIVPGIEAEFWFPYSV